MRHSLKIDCHTFIKKLLLKWWNQKNPFQSWIKSNFLHQIWILNYSMSVLFHIFIHITITYYLFTCIFPFQFFSPMKLNFLIFIDSEFRNYKIRNFLLKNVHYTKYNFHSWKIKYLKKFIGPKISSTFINSHNFGNICIPAWLFPSRSTFANFFRLFSTQNPTLRFFFFLAKKYVFVLPRNFAPTRELVSARCILFEKSRIITFMWT